MNDGDDQSRCPSEGNQANDIAYLMYPDAAYRFEKSEGSCQDRDEGYEQSRPRPAKIRNESNRTDEQTEDAVFVDAFYGDCDCERAGADD
jgi:hypothetical protein